MQPRILPLDHQHVLNHCAKHLARDRGNNNERWRFPIIDQAFDAQANRVTFLFNQAHEDDTPVKLVGSFAPMHQRLSLERIYFYEHATNYLAISLQIPHAQVHTYQFIISNNAITDPINPQQAIMDNNVVWSRFFTDYCTTPLMFEDWERKLLRRLCKHVLPFSTKAAENYLALYYNTLDDNTKRYDASQKVHQLDSSVGEINYIDKILAREENHHLIDYKICLDILDGLLRERSPYEQPHEAPKQIIIDIYTEMAANTVTGWPYKRYEHPRYFLELLRRHTVCGAFSHPKYGGNIGAAGWAYLHERYRNVNGDSLFNWREAMEKPLGSDTEYQG